jgi:hypothetical protein
MRQSPKHRCTFLQAIVASSAATEVMVTVMAALMATAAASQA